MGRGAAAAIGAAAGGFPPGGGAGGGRAGGKGGGVGPADPGEGVPGLEKVGGCAGCFPLEAGGVGT